MSLASCTDSSAPVPASVQAVIDTEFPADGAFHVRSWGRFEVRPETFVCHIRATVDPDLEQGAPTFYGVGIDGVENGRLNEDLRGRRCVDDGNNIISYWQLVENRTGAPYKIILAIWQGDPARGGAMWVARVERPDGKRPDVNDTPRFSGREFWRRRSIELDVNEISSRFWNRGRGQ